MAPLSGAGAARLRRTRQPPVGPKPLTSGRVGGKIFARAKDAYGRPVVLVVIVLAVGPLSDGCRVQGRGPPTWLDNYTLRIHPWCSRDPFSSGRACARSSFVFRGACVALAHVPQNQRGGLWGLVGGPSQPRFPPEAAIALLGFSVRSELAVHVSTVVMLWKLPQHHGRAPPAPTAGSDYSSSRRE